MTDSYKQPAHASPEEQAQDTLKKIQDFAQTNASPPKLSSAEKARRAAEGGDMTGVRNPQPPEERSLNRGVAYTAAADAAVGALGAARAQIENQLVADAKIQSDPRWERDQKVFEMGQKGQLGLVPPSEAELAVRPGVAPEVAEKLPKTPEEQVQDDMARLEQGEKRAEEITGAVAAAQEGVIKPGQQEDGTPPNNGETADAQRTKDVTITPDEPPKNFTIK